MVTNMVAILKSLKNKNNCNFKGINAVLKKENKQLWLNLTILYQMNVLE